MAVQHANAQQPMAKDLSLNGMAINTQLRDDIYIAAVYTEVGSSIAQMLLESDQNKRMELRVLTDRWSARSFAAHWNQALLINNSAQQLAPFEREIRQFTSAIRGKLIPGDKVTIDYSVKQYARLSVDGVPLLSVSKDPLQFFQLLLRCWIGPRPPSSGFKSDILDLPTDADGLLTRFAALVPISGRNKTIMAWRRSDDQVAATAKITPPPQAVSATAVAPKPKAPGPTPAPANTKQQSRIATASNASKDAKPETVNPAPKQPAASNNAPAASMGRKPAATALLAAPVDSTLKPTATPPTPDQTADEATPGNIENGLLDLYKSNLLKRVYSYVIYPARAIDRNQEGTVVLKVTVNRKGKVLNIKNDEPSRYRLLNSAATKAVKKASPFPTAPRKLQGSTFDIEFPIVFRLPQS